MRVEDFLLSPEELCQRRGPNDDIVLSSRVRLARNLDSAPFPGWAKRKAKIEIMERILPEIESLSLFDDGFIESMDALKSQEKQLLVERHLISREHAARGAGSAVVINKEESLCVMVNEEDHLRMQAIRPGFQITEAWEAINGLDDELEERLPYAFSGEFGYLTACPTNVGTAIRVSAMLHLPGLVLAEQVNQVVNSVNKLGLAVRGFYGEGTDTLGHVFQISNQMTLGESEPEIVQRLSKVLSQIIGNEQNAREKLLDDRPETVWNHIGRAYGTLSNAYSISSKETMNLLSLLRLGVELGYFEDLSIHKIDELFIVTQPNHLQQAADGKLASNARDLLRADILRERLASVGRPKPDKNSA